MGQSKTHPHNDDTMETILKDPHEVALAQHLINKQTRASASMMTNGGATQAQQHVAGNLGDDTIVDPHAQAMAQNLINKQIRASAFASSSWNHPHNDATSNILEDPTDSALAQDLINKQIASLEAAKKQFSELKARVTDHVRAKEASSSQVQEQANLPPNEEEMMRMSDDFIDKIQQVLRGENTNAIPVDQPLSRSNTSSGAVNYVGFHPEAAYAHVGYFVDPEQESW